MTNLSVRVELDCNSRVIQGLTKQNLIFSLSTSRYVSHITVILDVDAGRYDSEGQSYLCELLDVIPGDIISSSTDL